MLSPQNKLFQVAKLSLFLSCFAIWVCGQYITSDKFALSRFDKRIEEGQFTAVETDLLNYLIANPKDPIGFALMAKLRLRQGRLNEAKSLSVKALTLKPELLLAKLSLASAQFQLGEIKESKAVLDRISGSEAFDDPLGLSLAQTYSLVGDCVGAMRTTSRLSAGARDGVALPIRASCYLESGEERNFDTLMPLAKALVRQSPDVALKFAYVSSKASKHKETAELLRSVVVASPKNVDAVLLLAKSEIFLKDYANARIHIAQAENIKAVSANLFLVKAIFESEQGNTSLASDLLEKSLAEDLSNTEVLAQFVVTAMRADQRGKAVRAAEKLINLKPDDLNALYLFGAASLQNNNVQNAVDALEKFLKARPRDPRGCLALGLAFAAQTDKIPESRQQLEKCLTINPSNFEASYQLGLSYKAQGDAAKAIEYLEQTVDLSPEYSMALRDLGAAYLQAGREAKALPVLEKAVSLNPNDPETHFQLSRLYNLIGETELAKKQLRIFQDLNKAKNRIM